MAKYKDIADSIEQKIVSGHYKPGEPLEDQTTLAAAYKTTRVTVQKAIHLLAQKGLVYSRQGSGVYVKKNALLKNKGLLGTALTGTSNRLKDKHEVKTKVLDFQTIFPTPEECELLMLEKEQSLYVLSRLRIVDGEPFKLEKSLFPLHVIPNLTTKIAENSIYDYIKQDLQLTPYGANRVIRSAKPTAEDQEHLQAKADDPIFEVEQVVFLENGTPFEYSVSRSRYDKSEMVVNLDSVFQKYK